MRLKYEYFSTDLRTPWHLKKYRLSLLHLALGLFCLFKTSYQNQPRITQEVEWPPLYNPPLHRTPTWLLTNRKQWNDWKRTRAFCPQIRDKTGYNDKTGRTCDKETYKELKWDPTPALQRKRNNKLLKGTQSAMGMRWPWHYFCQFEKRSPQPEIKCTRRIHLEIRLNLA